MPAFNGRLKSNEIFSSIYNMIISQEVFSDNINGTYDDLVNMSRVDGGLYGDTKLFYATDALASYPWEGDDEAANLLATYRPKDPQVQAVTIDTFRQIRLTLDNYLSKRAWSTEGAFASFNSIMLGWMRDTKRVYDATTFNTYVGTAQSKVGKQTIIIDEITSPQDEFGAAAGTPVEEEATHRIVAQMISTKIANVMTELQDVSRDYNDYGNLRSYNPDDLVIVWNSKFANMITYMDLPTIHHKDSATPEKFKQIVLPERYFGIVYPMEATSDGTRYRSTIEKEYRLPAGTTKHVFAGDLIPNNLQVAANEVYVKENDEQGQIICKIMHKKSIPYMSGFEAGTSFFNAASLTENHYLTFGHNTLEYLKNYPLITIACGNA